MSTMFEIDQIISKFRLHVLCSVILIYNVRKKAESFFDVLKVNQENIV